jgi:hypothetical protein
MPKTLTPLDEINQAITRAWQALQDARTAATRSPNAHTVAHERNCENVLNQYLDAWHDYQ